MINNSLFVKAKNHIQYLNYDGCGNRGEYFTFKFPDGTEIPISIKKDHNGTWVDCKCKFHSNRDPNAGVLCSYMLALLLFRMTGTKRLPGEEENETQS